MTATDLEAAETPAQRRRRKDAESVARRRAGQAVIKAAHAREWLTAYAATLATGERVTATELRARAFAELAHLPAVEMPSGPIFTREAVKVLGPRVRRHQGKAYFLKRAPGDTPQPPKRQTEHRATAPVPVPAPLPAPVPADDNPTPATPAELTRWLDARARAMVPGVPYDAAELAHDAARNFAPRRVARNQFYRLADAVLGPRRHDQSGAWFPYYLAPS